MSTVAYMNVMNNMLFRAGLPRDVDPTTAGITVINHPINRTHFQMTRYLLYDYVSLFSSECLKVTYWVAIFVLNSFAILTVDDILEIFPQVLSVECFHCTLFIYC